MWERKPVSVRDSGPRKMDNRLEVNPTRTREATKKEKKRKKEAKETRRKPVLGQSAALLTQRRVSCLPRLSPKIPHRLSYPRITVGKRSSIELRLRVGIVP